MAKNIKTSQGRPGALFKCKSPAILSETLNAEASQSSKLFQLFSSVTISFARNFTKKQM